MVVLLSMAQPMKARTPAFETFSLATKYTGGGRGRQGGPWGGRVARGSGHSENLRFRYTE